MKHLMKTMMIVVAVTVAVPAIAGGGVTVGDNAPGFTEMDSSGNQVSLSDFAGKVVVLEWFSPGCPFVQRHYKAGTMKNLAAEYEVKEVVWIAVSSNYNVDPSAVAEFAATYELTYPILDDRSGKVGQLYGAKTTPHMYVINANGEVAYTGAIDDDPRGNKGEPATNYVAEALNQVLAGNDVTTAETKPYGCSVKYKN